MTKSNGAYLRTPSLFLSILQWFHPNLRSPFFLYKRVSKKISSKRYPLGGHPCTCLLWPLWDGQRDWYPHLPQVQDPSSDFTFQKWLTRQPQEEQSKCPGRVADVDICATPTRSSALVCLLCVHPSGPRASSYRGLLLHQYHPALWFSGFPNPVHGGQCWLQSYSSFHSQCQFIKRHTVETHGTPVSHN